VEKLAQHAPGSKITFRLLLDGEGADWPLSRKFGAHPDMIYHLIKEAKKAGLVPYGVSFHVGSQQRDIGQWDSALARCRYLFDALRTDRITLQAINLGGGFPAKYIQPTASTGEYARLIKRYLKEDFGDDELEIILEPGRSIAGDAGIIFSEVVLISQKSETQDVRWVYLDVGKFTGLIETLGEAIKYPIFVEGKDRAKKTSPVILAGPTCDSCDILYEDFKYLLPDSLKEGDRVNIFSTGAYTTSYSSVNFNGFPPLSVHIFDE
jgi:ornithine decarboxylase